MTGESTLWGAFLYTYFNYVDRRRIHAKIENEFQFAKDFSMMKWMRENFICSFLVVAATILCVLFSQFFVEENIGHHCEGEDCPICQLMLQCEKQLEVIGIVPLISIVLFFGGVELLKMDAEGIFIPSNSLLSQKVRFDD